MSFTPLSKWRLFHIAKAGCVVAALGVTLAGNSFADDHPSVKRTIAEQFIHDMQEGKIAEAGAEDHVVQELIIKRSIPITYKYINILMNTPNAFGPGVACTVCHNSQDASKSYRGLDLSTCKGMIEGTTEKPKHTVFTPGVDPKRDHLIRRLRNNRMPLGLGFENSTYTPSHMLVKNWIAEGAKNDDHFTKNVLPLFSTANAFGPNTPACTACHMSNQEPPSFHELNLSTHAGIMLGADSVAKGVDKSTKVIVPGKPELSFVWQHLAEDRMPPGISPAEARDHPNTTILSAWIKQGAKCD
ncbi:MAG: hypothetical protein PHQ58_06495 [Rhodoferax sp.]|uniref:hypothetical protein n=1 Tax=Rhodoferax sp. TaxID=50421 RepID=UPI0026057A7D|nr:hypothetical protein [Rhodoferax sp.]MDD2880067.1 hypothetical protein [Rhodoferax sp.]